MTRAHYDASLGAPGRSPIVAHPQTPRTDVVVARAILRPPLERANDDQRRRVRLLPFRSLPQTYRVPIDAGKHLA